MSMSSRLSIAGLREAASQEAPRGPPGHAPAGRDGLTGLIDRPGLMAAVRHLLAEGRPLALVLVHVDRLQQFNGSFGRETGDRLLTQLARHLETLAGTDGLAARLGGARFGLVVPDLADMHALGSMARDAASLVAQTVVDRSSAVTLGCVVGAAMAPADASTAEALIRKAELALFTVRAGSRSNWAIYRPSLLAALSEAIHAGVAAGQFSLNFQPIVTLAEPRSVVAVEALLRWLHPNRGLLFPPEFHGLLEEPGPAERISRSVLDLAIRQARRWTDEAIDFGRMSVNLSVQAALDPALGEQVSATLARHGVAPGRLMLEIPEEVRLGAVDSGLADRLQGLRDIGVSIALDGFSGSNASLDELKAIPFDLLKLDRGDTQDRFAAGRLAELLAAAPARGITVVLEGIDDAAMVPGLIELGARHAQGYLFRRPMPAPKLAEWLRAQAAARARA